jgi:cytochrome c biogenesis protein CcmG/thiol:disulfide interchange protein DsbE
MLTIGSAFLALALLLTAPPVARSQGTVVSPAPAQQAAPQAAAQAVPAAPPSPVSGIRNKLSAGDLLSAESVLEVHRAKNGEDGQWLLGLSWLARGALLMDDTAKARRYAAQVRASAAERMARGADLTKDHDLEIAYGAAIEVEAQCLERGRGANEAAGFVHAELARVKGPVPLIARLNKRLNMLALTGEKAPELTVEEFVGDPPPTLASLKGKPVLLFVWYEGCGDCKAQEAALAHAKSKYAERGLQVVALTRYYEDTTDHSREKFLIDSVWKSVYADVGKVPIVISTVSMERYGGSSTPTFVFVDREGIVRRYTPTRLTEEELDRSIEALIR